MSKREKRWAIWKIAATTSGCVVAAIVLFYVAALLRGAVEVPATGEAAERTGLTVPDVIQMFGVIMGILALLGFLWLGVRVREARKPPWERGKGKKRR